MALSMPASLKAQHEVLHDELVQARRSGGRTAEAADTVAWALHPHVVRQEEIVMPPLALLRPLAEGKMWPEMAEVLALTDSLEAELPQLLEQHDAIVAALEQLVEAAREEGKNEVAHFAEKLALHARAEEDVLYPAAILVGRYVRLMLRG